MNTMSEVSIGVTVYLPYCSFQAELSLGAIVESLTAMETALTGAGMTTADVAARITAVMSRSVNLSSLIAQGEINTEDGVSEIAFGFLYAYTRSRPETAEGDGLAALRGLAGCLADRKLYLHACPDRASYDKAVIDMREAACELLGYDEDEMIAQSLPRPTIH